jgi:signal transduction histidine kinase
VLPAEDAASLRVVDAMHRAAQRMSQLIESFSDLAKLQTGDLTLELGVHDVASILGEAHERFAPDACAQGIPFSVDGLASTEGVLLPCDRGRLLQSLLLMASCALRVVPERGAITVRTRVADTLVTFDVEARCHPDPSSRRITGELPKPELAIARGLIALHGADLAIAYDAELLELSCILPRDRRDLATPGREHPTRA